MSLELITVTTADGVDLDGAKYRPERANQRTARDGILVVHGMRWNFYRGPSRWLAPMLAERGFVCLALNLRDHDSTEPKGLDAAHHDLKAGIEHLLQECKEVILVAHGYGCTKVMCYAAHSGDRRLRRNVLTTLGAVQRNYPDIRQQALQGASAMEGETLVVQGGDDVLIEATASGEELARAAPRSHVEITVLEGANHYFDLRHQQLVDHVSSWISQHSPV